jgi:hypothetical protein
MPGFGRWGMSRGLKPDHFLALSVEAKASTYLRTKSKTKDKNKDKNKDKDKNKKNMSNSKKRKHVLRCAQNDKCFGRDLLDQRSAVSTSRSQSGDLSISRGLEPSAGPTMPSRSIKSIRCAARP